jgi:hypothetical protein
MPYVVSSHARTHHTSPSVSLLCTFTARDGLGQCSGFTRHNDQCNLNWVSDPAHRRSGSLVGNACPSPSSLAHPSTHTPAHAPTHPRNFPPTCIPTLSPTHAHSHPLSHMHTHPPPHLVLPPPPVCLFPLLLLRGSDACCRSGTSC